MLFSLDKRDYGGNYKNLDIALKYVHGAANAMAYFSNDGDGGRFTPSVSRYAAEFIKECIDDPNKMNPKPAWPAFSKKWKDTTEKYGAGKHWKFQGHVQNNIGVIYRGRHEQTVGIKRSVKVPRISSTGKQYGSPVSVAMYAAAREWGLGNTPEAPLFRPAIHTFINTHWPNYLKAVEKAVEVSVEDNVKSPVSTKKTVGSILKSIGKISPKATNILKRAWGRVLKTFGANKVSKELDKK
ncbi:MAG: hypothetical protein ACTSRW_16740 [Candidatus Helarchaeota archaeon]